RAQLAGAKARPRRQDPCDRGHRRYLPPRRLGASPESRSRKRRREGRRALPSRQDAHGPLRRERRFGRAHQADRKGNVRRGPAGGRLNARWKALDIGSPAKYHFAGLRFVLVRRGLDSKIVVAGLEIDFLVGADLLVLVDREIVGGEVLVG